MSSTFHSSSQNVRKLDIALILLPTSIYLSLIRKIMKHILKQTFSEKNGL